jgi:hypothetical protein
VHAVEHLAAIITLDVEDALHAEDVLAARLQQVVEPLVELRGIERARIADADRGDVVLVVMRGEPAFGPWPRGLESQAELGRVVLAEQRIRIGLPDRQLEVGARVGDVERVVAGARERAVARDDGRRFGERAHRGLDGGLERVAGRRGNRQHGDVEILVRMAVMSLAVMSLAVMSVTVMVVAVGFVAMLVRVVVVLAGRLQQIVAGRELPDTAPFERILRLEERLVHGQRALQVEGADVEHLADGHIGISSAEDLRGAVDAADAALDALERFGFDEVGLVEQHDVGERHLLGRLVERVDVLLEVLRIDHRHDRVERELVLEVVVEEERLRHRARIGHARGLDEDVVELVAALHELAEDADQVAAHRAADAAVVGLEQLLLGADDQLRVDADLAEFVLDDRYALAVLLREDAVQQRGFSGAEEAREHRDRYA